MGAQSRERSVLTGHTWGGCLDEVSCRQRGNCDSAPVERTGMVGTSGMSGMDAAGLLAWERVRELGWIRG